jgi:hypothetical protein
VVEAVERNIKNRTKGTKLAMARKAEEETHHKEE